MTKNTDFRLPFNDLTNYVPQNLRNPVITSLIDNLFNRFLTHDESVPLYGYVGRKPTFPDDRSPRVPQSSVERDISSVVPVLNFQLGTERHAFTVEDLISKAEAMGISPGSMSWLYSQGNNYLPPIDLDKFTNFFNYYWIAKAIPAVPSLPWNPTLAPEYYTIAAPQASDLNKLNVIAASTRNTVLTGSGFNKLSFNITFSDPTHFNITPIGVLGSYTPVQSAFELTTNNDHFAYQVTGTLGTKTLMEFDITREDVPDQFGNSIGLSGFAAGDEFHLDVQFLTRNYTLTFDGAPGVKGKLTRVALLNDYQIIDGVEVRAGDRVLIKNNSTVDDGIYIVSTGDWVRAPDFSGDTRVAGARVFDTNRNTMFESVAGGDGFGFQPAGTPGSDQSNTNPWQESNYWVSGDDLPQLGLARADAIQAVRPIIEYVSDIQLNSFVQNGQPSDSGTAYKQIKTEFNQLPMFDLFRYDGTHSGLVSSVFYYEEDVTANLDLKLQKRVKKSTNDSADFIFNHGMADDDGQLLFIKRSGELKSIWHAGYTEPTIVDTTFSGAGTGTFQDLKAIGFTQQQVWTLIADDATTFSIAGSKMPVLPAPHNKVTVGQLYNNGELEFTLSLGDKPFVPGDSFIIRVGNLESPRYVYRDENDGIYDRFGGPELDLDKKGAWQIPRTFYNNPYNDSRSPAPEGTLYSHFRGILSNQVENQPLDFAFGGSIKLWSEQQTLLASLLMQRDMTPISVISLAQRQYETALNIIADIFSQNIAKYIEDNGPVTTYDHVVALFDYIQTIRSKDNDVRTVLFDSTSPLIGFPATLPQLGLAELVQPVIEFDRVIGSMVMVHHDGHKSLVFQDGEHADLLNSIMLLAETRLYEGINPNARKYDFSEVMKDPVFQDHLKKELFAFAALNGYDPLGADYVSNDPFTWNYSQATQLAAMPAEIPARWFELLKAHHTQIPGVIPTERPNNEPWKLFGFETQDAWFNSLTAEKQAAYTAASFDNSWESVGTVKTAKTTPGITALTGLQTIEGVTLVQGDRVLLTSETSPENNGIWIANSGGWSAAQVPAKFYVVVSHGLQKGTVWGNIQPNVIKQSRAWSNEMWADIQAARPGLRLSVNTVTDELLPPYVNALAPHSQNALTNTMPFGASFGYSFGDSSPVETIWTRSLEYGYSLARALFRYDPLAFLGFCWGFNWVEVDGILYDGFDMSMPGHKRFRLHGDLIDTVARSPLAVTGTGTAIVTYDAYDNDRKQSFSVVRAGRLAGHVQAGVPATVDGLSFTIDDEGRPFRIGDRFEITDNKAIFIPARTYKYMGFGQTFTHALRETSIDTESSFAVSAFREWDVNMGYRAGGLVATDDLQVYTDAETLSPSAFELLFKKNQIARNEWVQALRINVINFGETVKKEAGVAPVGYGEDWVFRVEGYNPRYTSISFYDMTIAENPIDFHALGKDHTDLVWFNPTKINGVITTDLPMTITGVQNVVTFLFGYAKYLESRGWEFNTGFDAKIDAETGRSRNFQLEIEKFVDRCYAGIELGQGHVVNPFIDRAWFNQKTGLLSEFVDTSLFDVTGHPGVFDVVGMKFQKADLDIVRTNEQSSFGATAPMFSAHIQVDEFEHVFIFNNYSQPSTGSGLLYDPFSGARVVTYKFNGRKQATDTMRPEFGGHFLVGNQVHQNLQASTDNIAHLYDANHVFENETTSRHALALLGFNRKQYFDDLDISERTQFNFWRGLIQAKGTNLSIDAYLNNNRFDDAKIDEYWAYKLAEYGDARPHIFPELKLSVNDSLTQFTRLQFDNDSLKDNGFDSILSFDENRWFSLDDINQEVKFQAEVVGTFHRSDVVSGETYTLPFVADKLEPSDDYIQINSTTIMSNVDGELTIRGYGPARSRFNPVKVFNYVNNELVTEIPMWHPAAGQHTPTAIESINVISNLNPAKYNYSKEVVNNNTYDPLRPWGAKEVGRVWFDTRNLAYLPYYDPTIFPNLDERLSRWGTLADFATVDVYEWVQSSVPPTEYDSLARAQAGDAGLEAVTKAAGQVADKQTYSRERFWSARPIAWSFSPVATDVDWGATPPFVAGSTTADVYITNGKAVLENGTFEQLGIAPGMRIGAWDNDPANPSPLSEYVIEDLFTKDIGPSSFPSAAFNIDVEVLGTSDISGPLLFTAANRVVDNGDATWAVSTTLTAAGVDSGIDESAIVLEGIGTDGTRSFIPAVPEQPYIAPTEATGPTPEIPGTPGSNATFSRSVIVFDPPIPDGTDGLNHPTGFTPGTTYTSSFYHDNVSYSIVMPGTIQTIGEWFDYIRNEYFVMGSNWFISNGDIHFVSQIAGESGDAEITSPGNAITGLAGYAGISYQKGVDKTVATPTIPASPGSPASPGQPFIPAVPEQPASAGSYLSGATIDLSVGEKISVLLPRFQLRITAIANIAGVFPIDRVVNAIANALDSNLVMRDAVKITTIVETPSGTVTRLSNELDDNDFAPGWRVWSVPTQDQLNADGQAPFASWKPYVGQFAEIAGSHAQIQDAVAYAKNPLTLRSGEVIKRYKTTWSDWSVIKNLVMASTSVSTGEVLFTSDVAFDPKRVSVYVNGIAQLKAAFRINGKTLTLKEVSAGAQITVIVRKYEPTGRELAFDPDIKDDLSFQQQYKQDYEYVALPTRDREGALSSTIYFFWVKNKTTPALGKKQSVQSIAQQLREGPVNFLTFQNMSTEAPYTYDAITISGLSYVVTKDDTFKLRFTRNFTLRDDPEELNLKNVHTEWALMRPGQKQRIPETLWNKLVDSIVGIDAAGNVVPAIRRTLYDERNGTRTQFGFGPEQTLAPSALLKSSIVDSIVNTKLVDDSGKVVVPDFITFLDTNLDEAEAEKLWFNDPATARKTMTDIWNQAKVVQVNEIFFAALNDILASNYELSDIFKTSRISAYSIKVIASVPVAPTFE